MEEKRLTEKESLELIAEMIQNTKDKIKAGDGNLLLLWGYVSVITAALVYAVGMLTHSPHSNWIWMLIPLVGYPLMQRELKKGETIPTATTYVDKITAGIWQIVGGLAFVGMTCCFGFMFCGYNCWTVMLMYAFVIVGFGTAVQGVVIRERSLVFGGAFSICAGTFVICCYLSNVPLKGDVITPLYVASFIFMMIVPGHIINRKARKSCPKN